MKNIHLILNGEWEEPYRVLPDESLGKLVKALFAYHNRGDVPQDLPLEALVLFLSEKPFLDENRDKYEKKCASLQENGGKGGRPKNQIKEEKNQIEEEKNQKVLKKTKSGSKSKSKSTSISNSTVSDETEKERGERSPDFLPASRAPGLPENVDLTEEERERLEALYPNDWKDMVDHFSLYLFNHPEKKYRRPFDTIREWARKDGIAEGQTPKTYDLDDFFEAAVERTRREAEALMAEEDSS